MITIEMTVIRESNGAEIEIPVEAEFEVSGPTRGSRNSFGVPMEPDTDGDCEFDAATNTETGEPIDLTDDEIEEATTLAYRKLAGQILGCQIWG